MFTACTNNVSRRSFAGEISRPRQFLPLLARNFMTCFGGESAGNAGLIIDRGTQVFVDLNASTRSLARATFCQTELNNGLVALYSALLSDLDLI